MIKRIIGIVKKICVLDSKEPPLIKIQLAKFSHGQGSLAQLRLYVIGMMEKRSNGLVLSKSWHVMEHAQELQAMSWHLAYSKH